jgi:MFS transporter, ACS family, D-galactonate transporter
MDSMVRNGLLTHKTRTRARFFILALVTVGTAINYLDRTVLGIAAPLMSKELGLNDAVMGIVFSAFSWTYAAAQIPGGIFLDRFGTRLTYFLSATFWSIFTLLQGFVTGLSSLLVFRLGLGVFEAPCFPANSRILSIWFPQQERARATGVYSVGQYFGLAFLSPLFFWLTATFGWRVLFFGVGAIGIIFGMVWFHYYRDPHQSKSVGPAELSHIEAGGGLGYKGEATRFSWRNVALLLSHRQIVGASIGQFAGNSTLVFFLTWFPTYLATARHMTLTSAGFMAFLPYIFASLGVLAGGDLSDKLLKLTKSANIARKVPIVGGLLLASTIVAANYVQDNASVIAIMSVAFFGQGMVNLGWTVIADVAPKKLMGLTGGVFNFCTNLAGILTPLVIGFVLSATGSFVYALAFIGCVALVGVFSYVFVLGDIHRLEIEPV